MCLKWRSIGGSFLWINFQSQAKTWTCSHRHWVFCKFKVGLQLENQSILTSGWLTFWQKFLHHFRHMKVRSQILLPLAHEMAGCCYKALHVSFKKACSSIILVPKKKTCLLKSALATDKFNMGPRHSLQAIHNCIYGRIECEDVLFPCKQDSSLDSDKCTW